MGKILNFQIGHIDKLKVLFYADDEPSGVPCIVLGENSNKYRRMRASLVTDVVIAKDELVTDDEIEETIEHNLDDFDFCCDCISSLPYSVVNGLLQNKYDFIPISAISRLTVVGERVFILVGEKEIEINVHSGVIDSLRAELRKI